MNESLIQTEKALHELANNEKPRCVFILGAPRTGSTILYQTLISSLKMGYISNLTNDFFNEYPALGFAIQAGHKLNTDISDYNRFGKTEGLFQPSEGSYVLKKWFGGGHPSQLVSKDLLPGISDHMISTLKYANLMYGKPCVIKNPWNCFRVKSLSEALPEAYFIWIRRDIGSSSKSDLSARYVVQNSPEIWNSATPANVEQLLEKPYWEQVVENQYEFNIALENELSSHAQGRFIDIWYEDFCDSPNRFISQMHHKIISSEGQDSFALTPNFNVKISEKKYQINDDENLKIDTYIQDNLSRFERFKYEKQEIARA